MNILLISLLAGITTIIGCFPIFLPYSYHDKIIGISLSFSAGIMLSISIFSLIPESFSFLKELNIIISFIIFSIFFIIGVLFSKSIDKMISLKEKPKLYQIGIVSMISLILHNIPEGIITYLTASEDFTIGISLAIAIAIHNIPEGIAIAIPIYYATSNLLKSIMYTAISGLSEFLGAIITYIFIKDYISSHLLMSVLAATAGIMMDISLSELLPEASKYLLTKEIRLYFLLGCIIMLICICFFHIG